MSEPLNIALCEDTKQEAEKLLEILKKSKIANVCTVFESGEALLAQYRPQKYDLLLMDIYMGGMTGIEAAAKIRAQDKETTLAFITTSTDHALDGYRLSALKYIEKPCSAKAVEEILHLTQMKQNDAPCLLIQKSGKYKKIPLSHIQYLEQQKRQVLIYKENGTAEEVYGKLAGFLPQLENAAFFRPHKSYIVNLAFVQDINDEYKYYIMANDKNIPIRREAMGEAKKALEQFLFSQTRGDAQ